MDKNIILVLGMHRSGTSAMGGILHTLGINMGNNLVAASKDNKKGYYEDKDILFLNEKILSLLNSSWDDLSLLQDKWWENPHLKDIEQEAYELIEQKLDNEETLAIKDPRMCILFPFWEKIFKKQNLNIKCIYIFRHPLEVASSLKKRNDFSKSKSIFLWLKYNYFAIRYASSYQNIIVSYLQLFSNLDTKLNSCFNKFSLEYFDIRNHKRKDLVSFIDKSLHRNIVNIDDSNYKTVLSIYDNLLHYSKDDTISLNSEIFNLGFENTQFISQNNNIVTDILHDHNLIQKKLSLSENTSRELRIEVHERTNWALDLQNQLDERTNWALDLQNQLDERTNWALDLEAKLKKKRKWGFRFKR